jgi:hypothetical protein
MASLLDQFPADSQETIGEDKVYVEKIEVRDAGNFFLCIGGAGIGSLVDGFIEAATDAVFGMNADAVKQDIKAVLESTLLNYYAHDVKAYPGKGKQIAFLVCVTPKNRKDVFFWESRAARFREVSSYAVIGYEAAFCKNLAKRLYRQNLPLGQIVALAVYLVSIAKGSAVSVGGDTSIVVIRDNGVYPEEKSEIQDFENRISKMNLALDEVLLSFYDLSFTAEQFKAKVQTLGDTLERLRKEFLASEAQKVRQKVSDKNWRGDPYQKFPLGTVVRLLADGGADVVESAAKPSDTKESETDPHKAK